MFCLKKDVYVNGNSSCETFKVDMKVYPVYSNTCMYCIHREQDYFCF